MHARFWCPTFAGDTLRVSMWVAEPAATVQFVTINQRGDTVLGGGVLEIAA